MKWVKYIHIWFTVWHSEQYSIMPNNNDNGYPYSLDYKGESLGDFKTLSSAKLFAHEHNVKMENLK